MISFYVFFGFLLVEVYGLYDIPSYYGHFSKKFFLLSEIESGTFTYFEYHFAVDANYNNTTVFYANKDLNCIQKYDVVNKTFTKIAGQCGVSGDRIGNIKEMQMNGPQSVAYFHPNDESYQSQGSMEIKIVYNDSCDVTESSCLISSQDLERMTLNIDNLRAYPEIILFPEYNSSNKQYLYVSDTNNHCIKRIDLEASTSTVVAGECGESGFLDGPLGINRLYRPTNLGISAKGVVYFYDEGNQYFRKISQDGEIMTLLNGACKQFGISRSIQGYELKKVLCYDDWVEQSTKATTQHFIDDSQLNICLEHSSKC